jgi:hypothetical protein
MLGMGHHTQTDTATIRMVAKALLREIEQSGHVCLHSEDWGAIKTDLATVKHETAQTRQDVKELREEMAGLRAERRIAAAVIGFMGAVIGGIVTAIANR